MSQPIAAKPSQPLSDQLEGWAKGAQPKTLATLIEVSEDKSFAVVLLFLMLLPALPIPTGGISHVLELIAMLVALELIAGRRTIWLPQRWQKLKLSRLVAGKTLPLMLRRIRWLERRSTPRGRALFSLPLADRINGVLLLLLIVLAFISPPFSGIDTLPSLGVVVICLAIILEDAWLFAAGTVVGALGVALVATLGTAAFEGVKQLF